MPIQPSPNAGTSRLPSFRFFIVLLRFANSKPSPPSEQDMSLHKREHHTDCYRTHVSSVRIHLNRGFMYCPNCGQQQVSDEMRFCSRCGLALTGLAEWLGGGMLVRREEES